MMNAIFYGGMFEPQEPAMSEQLGPHCPKNPNITDLIYQQDEILAALAPLLHAVRYIDTRNPELAEQMLTECEALVQSCKRAFRQCSTLVIWHVITIGTNPFPSIHSVSHWEGFDDGSSV